MLYEADANVWDVHPLMEQVLEVADRLHFSFTERELFVTSLRRPPGERRSSHSPPDGALVTAADLRTWYLDHADSTDDFAASLRWMYGAALTVLLEPDDLSAEEIERRGGRDQIPRHIHLEIEWR